MILPRALEKHLSDVLGGKASILEMKPVGGGCINECAKLTTPAGCYFIKWNNRWQYPGMLAAEASGLKLLKNTNTIRIPAVLGHGEADDLQFLLLEFIDSAPPVLNFWKLFGEQLAALHQVTNSHFGLDYTNYMGSLQQSNAYTNTWIEFFIQQRINPQLTLAVNNRKLPATIIKKFENLFTNLHNLLPAEKPALVHGDLWSGNLLCNSHGPVLIDPAVHFGNREADLAMTFLFGGFDLSFLDVYKHTLPLAPEFNKRLDIYNLYPLLIHVNLFGGGYATQVTATVSNFS